MKIPLTFKTPDVVSEALEDVPENQHSKARRVIKKFIEYDEYVTIEIDTDTGEASVLPL